MSQIAVIEINEDTVDMKKIKNKRIKDALYLDVISSYRLNFFKEGKLYIEIINDLESREFDALIFDFQIDLKDFKKIYEVISPLFDAVRYLIDNRIDPKGIKLYISEDCNADSDDYIEIIVDHNNVEEDFIKFIKNNSVIESNFFPPLSFCFI